MFTPRVVSGVPAANSGNVKKSRFTASLVAGALWICALMIPSMAHAQSGWVRNYTGMPCVGLHCQFWEDVDRNGITSRIAVSGGNLYQIQINGAIWKYPGTPCASNCPAWQLLSTNPAAKAIYADGAKLYQLRGDGSIWRFTGTACNLNSCEGWEMLDNNPATVTLAAGGGKLYQLHNTGKVFRSTDAPCDQGICAGWELLGDDSRTVAIAASASGQLYRLLNDGSIWLYGITKYDEYYHWIDWDMLEGSSSAVAISAGGSNELYKLHNNGTIWRYTVPGWELLDNNPLTVQIVAAPGKLYQLHSTGALWRYVDIPCNGNWCYGWEELMHDGVGRIAGDGTHLYQLNGTPTRATRDRVCYECRP